MNENSTISADSKEQLQVEETDDSCRVDFIEIVPLIRGTDGSCTTESDSGDWFLKVKQENLTLVKQEPDDVCCVIYVTISLLEQKKFEDQCQITFFVPMHLFCNCRSHTALFESIINFA